jgi:fermentation-respiration switch protein FrsA (DUF1100 family)
VAAKEPLVKGVVIESAFSSYRSMSRVVLGKNWFLWPLWPVFPLFLGKTYDPVRWVGKISPRPVLFVRGDQDTIVPPKMTERLFEAANEPKRIIRMAGADHLQMRRVGGKDYERTLAEFFEDALNNKD